MQWLKSFIFGADRNPMSPDTRRHIALIAFFAWIGLGADGLSSIAYGPELGYLALGNHQHLALYLAFATGITVFIISLAYNQVIELFPSGGGGYKVAVKLIGPTAGVISGAALILDYVLTIAISIASGADALFSLLPLSAQTYKLDVAALLTTILLLLNLRGLKESVRFLMPIFLGFVITHTLVILYGIFLKIDGVGQIFKDAISDTVSLSAQTGWFFTLSLFLKAYSMGGGTYTGLEAVSNNVNHLVEPRVRTGKWTMFYMAISLSLTAAGIIFLYLLWQVEPVPGKTLNAVVFNKILNGELPLGHMIVVILLFFEAGLLFIGANTGFLGGPAVLANMALDDWVPHRYRELSSRLVTQNGIIVFGVAALFILLWSNSSVETLAVLYSMNVFLTFSISLFGLCIYWIFHGKQQKERWSQLLLALVGFVICISILITIIWEKFFVGGWLTLIVTGMVIATCFYIKHHYHDISEQVGLLDRSLMMPLLGKPQEVPALDPEAPTAVFFVNENIGAGIHTLLWSQRLFPHYFHNYVFVSVGVIDVGSYGSNEALANMQKQTLKNLNYFIQYMRHRGKPATVYCEFGSDPIAEMVDISEKVHQRFPNTVFFAGRVVSKADGWVSRILHGDTAIVLQRLLHLRGLQMVILPIKIDKSEDLIVGTH